MEIFSRLNTQGSKITKDQMLSALTYKEGSEAFDLAKHLDELTEMLVPLHMGRIRRLALFRVVLAAAGSTDVYRGEWPDYKEKTVSELSSIVSRARSSLLAAAHFLRDDLEVPNDSLLPYSSCLIPLSEFFRSQLSPSPEQRSQLKRWFWATSFSGVFASINSTSMATMLDELRQLGNGDIAKLDAGSVSDRARPFPARFDMHSARLRVLLLVMLRRLSPLDSKGHVIDGAQVIREYGSAAFAKVFTDRSDAIVGHPANRIFLGRPSSSAARKAIGEIAALNEPVREQVLRSHAISSECLQAALDGDAETFIRLRKQTLIQVERDFLKELGIPAPEATFESDDVDADDEGL